MSDYRYTPPSASPPAGAGAPIGPARLRSPAQRRHVTKRWGVVVLVAALLVLGLSWHAIDRPHKGVAAGFVQNTGVTIPTAHHATLLLPWGQLSLATSTPRTRLPHAVAEGDVGGDIRPPSGGRFVGVRWNPGGDKDQVSVVPLSLSPARGANTLVSLVTGGHSYPLAPELRHSYCPPTSVCLGPYSDNAAWLAVDGAATDVSISVTFDGVTQTVDMSNGKVDRGRAQGLSASSTRRPACGTPTWQRGFRGDKARCAAAVTRSPWVSGLGWASAGHEWVVAAVFVERPYKVVGSADGRASTYYVSGSTATLSFAVAGGHRVAQQPTGTDDGDLPSSGAAGDTSSNTVAFSVPLSGAHHPLSVHATWNLDPSGSRDVRTRATSHATATWTVAA